MKRPGKPAVERAHPRQAGLWGDRRCRGAPGEAGSCSAAPVGGRPLAPTSSCVGAPAAREAEPPEWAGWPWAGPPEWAGWLWAEPRQKRASWRHLSAAEGFSVWEPEGLSPAEGCQGSTRGARL